MAKQSNPLWENDLIQFARLLDELNAVTVIPREDFARLCASMDLEPADVKKLFARAEKVWEKAKQDRVALAQTTLPLVMTSNQQSMLAELCQALRTWEYACLQKAGADGQMPGCEALDKTLIVQLWDVFERFGVKPTQLDVLYDKLHRSGANA